MKAGHEDGPMLVTVEDNRIVGALGPLIILRGRNGVASSRPRTSLSTPHRGRAHVCKANGDEFCQLGGGGLAGEEEDVDAGLPVGIQFGGPFVDFQVPGQAGPAPCADAGEPVVIGRPQGRVPAAVEFGGGVDYVADRDRARAARRIW